MAKKNSKYKSELVDKFYQKWLSDAISYLANSGGQIIEKAYNDSVTQRSFNGSKNDASKWANRTFNLHDSYGSAVYLNGVLQKETIRYVGAELATLSPINGGSKGRDVLNSYLNQQSRINNRELLRLICVAAIDYAGDLEEGVTSFVDDNGSPIDSRKYVVISLIHDDMADAISKFGKFGDINSLGL